MRILVIVGWLAVVACAGNEPPSSGKCVGVAYDPCNEEHDCMSSLCQNFPNDGFQVCSQACDDMNPCPGDGVCENAVCKPPAANDCSVF